MLNYKSNGMGLRATCPWPCGCPSSSFAVKCSCGHPSDSHRSIEDNWEHLTTIEFTTLLDFIEKDQVSKSVLVIGDSNFLPNTTFIRNLEQRFLVQNLSVEYGLFLHYFPVYTSTNGARSGINAKGAYWILNTYLKKSTERYGIVSNSSTEYTTSNLYYKGFNSSPKQRLSLS
jgi:hypothetical protein